MEFIICFVVKKTSVDCLVAGNLKYSWSPLPIIEVPVVV